MLELQYSLEQRNLRRPRLVAMDRSATRGALRDGRVDLVVGFVDALPRNQRLTGMPLRAIHVGLDIYASGLVAGDHVADDVVAAMRAALAAAVARQAHDHKRGLDLLCERYAETRPDEAVDGWALVEPFVLAGGRPCAMDASRWAETVRHATALRGISGIEPREVYRPAFARGQGDALLARGGSNPDD